MAGHKVDGVSNGTHTCIHIYTTRPSIVMTLSSWANQEKMDGTATIETYHDLDSALDDLRRRVMNPIILDKKNLIFTVFAPSWIPRSDFTIFAPSWIQRSDF